MMDKFSRNRSSRTGNWNLKKNTGWVFQDLLIMVKLSNWVWASSNWINEQWDHPGREKSSYKSNICKICLQLTELLHLNFFDRLLHFFLRLSDCILHSFSLHSFLNNSLAFYLLTLSSKHFFSECEVFLRV